MPKPAKTTLSKKNQLSEARAQRAPISAVHDTETQLAQADEKITKLEHALHTEKLRSENLSQKLDIERQCTSQLSLALEAERKHSEALALALNIEVEHSKQYHQST